MHAALLALSAFFCFTLMDLSIKWLLHTYPLMQVTFFNCFFAMLGLLVWIYPRFDLLKTSHPQIHLLRATMVLIADLLAFYSYGQVPLAEAYTLILTMPLFTTIFAVLFKQDTFNSFAVVVLVLGFGGVYLMLSPQFGQLHWALLAAMSCAVIESLSFLLIGRYREQETPQAFAFYSLSLVTLVTGLVTLFQFQPMPVSALGISLAGGLCYALATALIVTAFHQGSPIVISSMQYSQLVWGMLLSFVIWQDVPSQRVLLGSLLITVAGLILLHSQKPKTSPTSQQPQ
jgi:drug/metabolite transporter (DMT)-like permease